MTSLLLLGQISNTENFLRALETSINKKLNKQQLEQQLKQTHLLINIPSRIVYWEQLLTQNSNELQSDKAVKITESIQKVKKIYSSVVSLYNDALFSFLISEFTFSSRTKDISSLRCLKILFQGLKKFSTLNAIQKQTIEDTIKTIKQITAPQFNNQGLPYDHSPFARAPKEIHVMILCHLSPHELLSFGCVCKAFHQLSNDSVIWNLVLQNSQASLKTKQEYLEQKSLIEISNNCWKKQMIAEIGDHLEEFEWHQNFYLSSHLSKEEADENEEWPCNIKVCDRKTHKKLAELTGHTDRIRKLLIRGDTLYSGSEDNTVRIWDLKTFKNTDVLKCQNQVYSLAQFNHILFVGTSDGIEVWDLNTKKQSILRGIAFVCWLQVQGNKLFCAGNYTGTEFNTVIIYDLLDLPEGQLPTQDNLGVVKTIKFKKNYLNILLDGDLLFLISYSSNKLNRDVIIYDIKNKCEKTISLQKEGFMAPLFKKCLYKQGGYLFVQDYSDLLVFNLNSMSASAMQRIKISEGVNNNIKIVSMLFLENTNELLLACEVNNRKGALFSISLPRSHHESLLFIAEKLQNKDTSALEFFQKLSREIQLRVFYEYSKLFFSVDFALLAAEQQFILSEEKFCNDKALAIFRYLYKRISELFKQEKPIDAINLFKKLPKKLKSSVYQFYRNPSFLNNDYAVIAFLNPKMQSKEKIAAVLSAYNGLRSKKNR